MSVDLLFDLQARGLDSSTETPPTEVEVSLHESFHQALTSSTSWGALSAVIAGPEPALNPLFEMSRRVHEAYATYCSAVLIHARDPGREQVPRRWRPLTGDARALESVVSAAESPVRRYLLATAVAYASMQCPVADVVANSSHQSIDLDRFAFLDLPDRRFAWVLEHPGVVSAGIQTADTAVQQIPNELAEIVSEHRGPLDAWLRIAFDHLQRELTSAGALVVSLSGLVDEIRWMLRAAGVEFRIDTDEFAEVATPRLSPDAQPELLWEEEIGDIVIDDRTTATLERRLGLTFFDRDPSASTLAHRFLGETGDGIGLLRIRNRVGPHGVMVQLLAYGSPAIADRGAPVRERTVQVLKDIREEQLARPDPLDLILRWAELEASVLEAESADRLAESLGFDAVTADEFVRVLAGSAEWDVETAPDGEFEFRVGRWRLDLAEEAARSGVMAALLGAVFAATGTDALGVALLAAIVPSLLEVQDVSLSAGDRRLLIDVRRLPGVSDRLVPADELYSRLPDDVRARLHRHDFADFLERLRGSDLAVGTGQGGQGTEVRIWRADERVPLIRWR